ncbi:MAG: hypothetical protein RLZZ210_212 [Pseudomonadota bacterium]|jgi:hypothetical protein
MDIISPTITVAIIAASASVIVPAITKYFEHQSLIKKELREKKIIVYEKIINLLIGMFYNIKMGEENNTQDLVKKIYDFLPSLISYGSDDVIINFKNWRQNSVNGNTQDILLNTENLLVAIRKDLTSKKTKLKSGDILGVFINNHL